MGKTFVFVNQKGGVGKTTSAINIGAYLALGGKKTLLVDFDSQGNMTSGVGVDRDKPTVYDLLSGNAVPEAVIRQTPIPGLSVIPASIDLSGAAIELVDQEKREFFLRNALAPVKDSFDFILVDCPPSLGLLTLNGLVAADEVLIPLQCESLSQRGVGQLLDTIEDVRDYTNPDLAVRGAIATMFDARTRLAHEVMEQVREQYQITVFEPPVPKSVKVAEAPGLGRSVMTHAPRSKSAQAYRELALQLHPPSRTKKR